MTLANSWVFQRKILVWKEDTTAESNSPSSKWILNDLIFNTFNVQVTNLFSQIIRQLISVEKTTQGPLPVEAYFLPNLPDQESWIQSAFCYTSKWPSPTLSPKVLIANTTSRIYLYLFHPDLLRIYSDRNCTKCYRYKDE